MKTIARKTLSALASLCLLAGSASAEANAANIPRPEHPRPDEFRENWMTLNGEWQFEITGMLREGANEVVVQVRDDQWSAKSGVSPRTVTK